MQSAILAAPASKDRGAAPTVRLLAAAIDRPAHRRRLIDSLDSFSAFVGFTVGTRR